MKTKKNLFVLFALFLICPVGHSQKSIDKLFNDFSKEKGVTHVNISKITMSFVSLFKNVMGVNGIDVLSFEDCEQSVKEHLKKEIASFKDENYETMISSNDGSEHIKVLVKLKDDFIQELIVLTTGDDPAIVRIKGKIKPSDFDNVISENKSNKK